MPITPPKGMREAVEARLAERLETMRGLIIRNLSYVGEQAVNKAREGHLNGVEVRSVTESGKKVFNTDTGNLVSSIGYVVALDGEVVQASDFQVVRDGSQGSSEGERYARSLVSKFPKGAALIVTAGMSYAGYVSAKGYDVIDGAELLAERLVPKLLSQLRRQ